MKAAAEGGQHLIAVGAGSRRRRRPATDAGQEPPASIPAARRDGRSRRMWSGPWRRGLPAERGCRQNTPTAARQAAVKSVGVTKRRRRDPAGPGGGPRRVVADGGARRDVAHRQHPYRQPHHAAHRIWLPRRRIDPVKRRTRRARGRTRSPPRGRCRRNWPGCSAPAAAARAPPRSAAAEAGSTGRPAPPPRPDATSHTGSLSRPAECGRAASTAIPGRRDPGETSRCRRAGSRPGRRPCPRHRAISSSDPSTGVRSCAT